MALDIAEFTRLKKEVDAARRKADEAAGVLKAAHHQLAELGLKSVEAAERKVAKLNSEIIALEKEFDGKLNEYRTMFDKPR